MMPRWLSTLEVANALKGALSAIPYPGATDGTRLFELVDFHENKRLREALQDLISVKQRVAIIVPSGDAYDTQRQGRTLWSKRSMTLDVLMADRSYTKGGYEAVFGGVKNVGVLGMKDVVVNYLADNAQLALPYVALQPLDGAMIELADAQVKDSPGRECWVQSYSTPAGEREIPLKALWPSS